MILQKNRVLARALAGSAIALTLPFATPATASGKTDADAPAQAGESAQPSGEQQDGTGEIIVTALKGGVSVQRSPVTVNIVAGEAIDSKGITSVDQLTSVVPGVRINQAPGGLVNPVVRGLGSSPSNNSFEQTVGLFVDGIFAGHPRDYSLALFDIERVELLKGTQSAVVGKNTSVGALSLVTRKPSFEFGMEGSYYHEFEFGTDTLNAAVNLPLSDTLAVRIAGQYSDEGGWVRNVFDTADEPRIKRKAIRATLRFRPSEQLDWTLSAQATGADQTGQIFHTGIDTLGNARAGAIVGGDADYVVRPFQTRTTPRSGFTYRGFSSIGAATDGSRFNSTLNYELGTVTLTSVTGYSEYTDTFLIDASSSINSPLLRGGHETDKAFSQELRLSTDPAKPLSFIGGGYYYHDKWFYEDRFDFNAAQLVAPSLGGAFTSSYTQTTETFSLFGQLAYRVSDSLRLAGSLRYEHFSKRGDYSPRTVLRPGGLTAAVYGPYAAFSRSDAKDYFDYSVQAQYFFAPRINGYVSYSTGTKGFGFVATPTSPGGVVTNPAYNTELSETLEAGIKAGFGGGSTVNLALFSTKLKDYQIGVNLGTNFLIRNDQIRSRGVEADINFALSEALRAAATVTYADVVKRPPLPANSIPNLPYAPEWSGIAGIYYNDRITDDFRLKAEVTGEFRSSQQLSDVVTFPIPREPGRLRTDLRLGVEYEPYNLEVALVARNIFNVYSLAYGFNQFGSTGAAQVAEEMPRTIGVQVSFRR